MTSASRRWSNGQYDAADIDATAFIRWIAVLTNLWFFDHLEAALKNENVLLVIGAAAVVAELLRLA